jgi:PleD family two-component response regulator
MPRNPRKLLAVLNDLFFMAKINEATKRAGMAVGYAKTPEQVIELALAEPPALIIVDLNATALKPLEVIARLKSEAALKGVSVLGYVSHIDSETKLQAQRAGADMVLARSAFSLNLPQILKRHAA